jgi:hypothetical protein
MRRLAISTICAVVVFAGASPSGARSHRKPSITCPPTRARVLLADSQAAIYTDRETLAETGPSGEHDVQVETRGCARGSKHSYGIDAEVLPPPTETSYSVRHLALGGSVLAYEEWSTEETRYSFGPPVGAKVWRLVVRDLRTERVLHRVPTAANPRHPTWVGDGEATMILVTSDGGVAWINDTIQESDRYQVHVLDRNGNRVLASGTDIDPHSLALAGRTLYWTQGGKPFSTPLN